MKCIDKLRADLKAIGAELDGDERDNVLNCDAPRGYVWAANDCGAVSDYDSQLRRPDMGGESDR